MNSSIETNVLQDTKLTFEYDVWVLVLITQLFPHPFIPTPLTLPSKEGMSVGVIE